MSAQNVLALIQEHEVKFVDLRFTDTKGKEQHVSIPSHQVDEDFFEDGKMFDGSSIGGWKGINESDMVLMPDPASAKLDPFTEETTLNIVCDVLEPATMQGYDRDPRSIAKRAEDFLKSSGIADTVLFGPEPEFFMFDNITFSNTMGHSFVKIESEEAAWNSGTDYEHGNKGHRPFVKGGYFPVAPVDSSQDIRAAMCLVLEEMGQVVEAHHHEVATAGQNEIATRFNTLTLKADEVQVLKYVIHNVAHAYNKTVTFMPKPMFGDNGSGMHCHQSLWKDGKPLFYDEKNYGGLSDLARWYIGGLIKHSSSVLAFTNPSLNSYHRLVPGFEAPVNLVYSARNRSAAIRIPLAGTSPAAKRIEFRAPDPSCNPFLAFSAQLMAGLDGILNHIEPPAPVDKDLYELPPEEHAGIKQVPSSLAEAMDALEEDHDFLTAGDVFTDDLIETWINIKRGEIDQARLAPTPLEYELYFHI